MKEEQNQAFKHNIMKNDRVRLHTKAVTEIQFKIKFVAIKTPIFCATLMFINLTLIVPS